MSTRCTIALYGAMCIVHLSVLRGMRHTIFLFFTQFPPQLATLLMAILPIAERFALPFAIAKFHLPVWEAFVLCVLGNLVPVTIILALADRFHAWLSHNDGFFGKAWAKSVAHAQTKFAKYEKYGLVGLFLFLILPTPVNGAFSASLVAFVLGYPMKKSYPYLLAGVIAYNIIALAATVGVVRVF